MNIEAMKQALEALENVTKDYVERRQYKHNKAIDALRAAIETYEKQEPLGYWNAVEGWVELPEEAHKPAQAKTIPKWPLKHKWVNGRGYVVWRDVFEGNMKCPLDEAIAAHTQSVFVDEADAKEYCTFKNTTPPAAQWVGLTDEEISDIAINNPPMVHEFARAIEAKLKENNT